MTDVLDAPTTATTADKVRFSLRNLPLVSSGATMDKLGAAENLWAHSKVYARGGENALHWHEVEDHMFLVLQGTADFSFEDGSTCTARQYEGVFMPKKTAYRFHAGEGENLVLIRIGGAQVYNPQDIDPQYGVPREVSKQRVGGDGQALDGLSKKNGTPGEPTVFIPDRVFAPN